MKSHYSKIILSIVGCVLALVMFGQEPVYARESKEIFAWVARQMNIADAGPLPVMHYVDKAELQAAFIRLNRNSYQQWEAQYGEHQADKFMTLYLQELVGMFDPHTGSVYVGNFLPLCRQEAILAHEFTHYFQDRQYGGIQTDSAGAQDLLLMREMEAGAMEKRYGELFCKDR